MKTKIRIAFCFHLILFILLYYWFKELLDLGELFLTIFYAAPFPLVGLMYFVVSVGFFVSLIGFIIKKSQDDKKIFYYLGNLLLFILYVFPIISYKYLKYVGP